MKKAILGKKLGMSQIFTAEGIVIPVTIIEAGPCPVVQIKTTKKMDIRLSRLIWTKERKNVQSP